MDKQTAFRGDNHIPSLTGRRGVVCFRFLPTFRP